MYDKIPMLVYNTMFKAVFSNNKQVLSKLIEAILDYLKLNIDIKNKELILKNTELPINNHLDKQLICDYIINLNEYTDLNIEINKTFYPGLTERNMTYSFKIYYEHFKTGDKNTSYNKFNLLQVNFNNFSNPNNKTINKFFLIDTDDLTNVLSKNLLIMNIDIASCFNLAYNSTKLTDVSLLERFAGILYAKNLKDISLILGGDMLSMEEKEQILNDVERAARDKKIQEDLRLEDNIEYRFTLVEEDAFERGKNFGIEQGIKQNTLNIIEEMLNNNIDINTISKVTGKSIDEIEQIKNNI